MEVLGLVSVDQRRRGGGFKAKYRLGTVGRNEKRFGGYKGRRRVGSCDERRLACDVTYNNESQSVIILVYLKASSDLKMPRDPIGQISLFC